MQKIFNFLHNWKREIITFLVAFACLFLAISFPAKGALQLISRIAFFLVLLPALFIKLVLQKNLCDFGLNFSERKKGIFGASLMLLFSFFIAVILFYFFNLEEKYVVPIFIINHFWAFVFYELIVIGIILFVLSFFFHGFLQTTLEKKFGFWAPFFQFILFISFLFFIEKLTWQYTPLIIFSLTGGIASYYSRSFLFSCFSGIVFILFLDLYIIELVR